MTHRAYNGWDMDLAQRLQAAQRTFDGRLGEARMLTAQLDRLRDEQRAQQEQHDRLVKLGLVLTKVSQDVSEQFLRSIEQLVSEGLQAVFDDDSIRFSLTPTVRGSVPGIKVAIETARSPLTEDLLDAHGGGLVSVVGLMLRIVTLRLLSGTHRQILLLDEPLAHLSDAYVEPAAALLRRLASDLGIQVVLVTHQPDFAAHADRVYRLTREQRATVAREERT